MNRKRPVIVGDGPGSCRQETGETFEQRRFARTIRTDETQNLARAHSERDIVQSTEAPERLGLGARRARSVTTDDRFQADRRAARMALTSSSGTSAGKAASSSSNARFPSFTVSS